jgi:hypothetical protein
MRIVHRDRVVVACLVELSAEKLQANDGVNSDDEQDEKCDM